MSRARAWLAATLTVALLGLTGCTGVPTSSAPQTIKPVSLGAADTSPAMSPAPGIEPRPLVYNFLTANGIEPGRHASARTFLSPAARSRWSDTSATIVSDETVGTFKPGSPQVVVRGRIVGSLSSEGIYTPSLGGTGNGAALTAFPFTVKKIAGQYRIDSLPPGGLLLTTDQFQQTYKQHSLYFFDLAGRYLVPDVRWSGLQGTALEQWLVDRLVDGPSDGLQKAVNSDTFPTQAAQRTISIKSGTTTAVDIRGAQQLGSVGKDQLAAQLSYTLDGASAGDLLSITDNGKGVHIPAANSAEFTSSSFDGVTGPITPQPDVYYLRYGRIHTDNGRLLPGPVNDTYDLNSIGLERTGSSTTLNVAGTVGTGSGAQLVVGTQRGGLHPVAVSGLLSRPAWVPGSNEVWVGAGPDLWRTTLSATGRPGKPTRIALPATAPRGAQIVALRLSPEGSRVAMVLELANGAKQLFVGSVVRSAGQVRIDTLTPVSPAGVVVTDVAWIEPAKLFAIGHNAASRLDPKVFETNVDGSLWSARQFTLPYAPDSVTYAVGQLAWVSSGGYVWVQKGLSDWQSPGAISQTLGTAPVYLE